MGGRPIPPVELFERHAFPEPNSGCWLWAGPCYSNGYGDLRKNKWHMLAHRWSYEHFIGPIPEGLDLDHLCRVRSCVNPAHLEPVTRRINLLRGDTIPARFAARTHCLNGHELIPENFRKNARGRECRLCFNARAQGYKARG